MSKDGACKLVEEFVRQTERAVRAEHWLGLAEAKLKELDKLEAERAIYALMCSVPECGRPPVQCNEPRLCDEHHGGTPSPDFRPIASWQVALNVAEGALATCKSEKEMLQGRYDELKHKHSELRSEFDKLTARAEAVAGAFAPEFKPGDRVRFSALGQKDDTGTVTEARLHGGSRYSTVTAVWDSDGRTMPTSAENLTKISEPEHGFKVGDRVFCAKRLPGTGPACTGTVQRAEEKEVSVLFDTPEGRPAIPYVFVRSTWGKLTKLKKKSPKKRGVTTGDILKTARAGVEEPRDKRAFKIGDVVTDKTYGRVGVVAGTSVGDKLVIVNTAAGKDSWGVDAIEHLIPMFVVDQTVIVNNKSSAYHGHAGRVSAIVPFNGTSWSYRVQVDLNTGVSKLYIPSSLAAKVPKEDGRLTDRPGHGKLWTTDDDRYLRNAWGACKNSARIAFEMGRSARAVVDRCKKLGLD